MLIKCTGDIKLKANTNEGKLHNRIFRSQKYGKQQNEIQLAKKSAGNNSLTRLVDVEHIPLTYGYVRFGLDSLKGKLQLQYVPQLQHHTVFHQN